jgi:hypothetical protein
VEKVMAVDSDEPFNSIPSFDETLAEKIDFRQSLASSNWLSPSEHYQRMPQVARQEVDKVVKSDKRMRAELRKLYFPQLKAAKTWDLWHRDDRIVKQLQEKQLYTGRVVAADGALARYETLSMVGAQIAVARVSYQGSTGQYVSNIEHWGKEVGRSINLKELTEAMSSRGKRAKQKINNVLLQSIMQYKEREVLLNLGPQVFKLIHGPLFPYEMLVGGGAANTLQMCLNLLGRLIDDGAYATIVSSSMDRDLMVLGMALEPGEYAVRRSGMDLLEVFMRRAHFTDAKDENVYEGKSEIDLFKNFITDYGTKVVEGVLRAHQMSRPYIFYCNTQNLHKAVHMLFADAAHTGPRGFPLLIDLADQYCSGSFKASEYTAYMNAEFTRASGGSTIYLSERATRD